MWKDAMWPVLTSYLDENGSINIKTSVKEVGYKGMD
jgi:hypothetical protein